MAQERKDKEREVDEEDREESSEETESETAEGGEDALARGNETEAEGEDALARTDDAEGDETEGEEGGDGLAPAQLGVDRYVLAGFFAAGMLGAYVLGRTLQMAWAAASN